MRDFTTVVCHRSAPVSGNHIIIIMLWVAVTAIVVGLTRGQPESISPEEREWNCLQDHAPHPSDPRKFLQSPNGFGEGAAVTEAICPSRLQVFSQSPEGVCSCLYTDELRDLLDQPCPVRIPAGVEPQFYETLSFRTDVETIEELYERRSCNDVLPQYVVNWYRDRHNVNTPLFFNTTRCRCDWTPAALRVVGSPPVPQSTDQLCERLTDQSFNSNQIGSDQMGNTIEVFPFDFQRNVTTRRGGAVFGQGLDAAVMHNLRGVDFTDINLVARFDSDLNSGTQLIFSNQCRDAGSESGGIVDLQYNPSGRQYTLRYFGSGPVTCIASSGPGTQTVQVKYKVGVVTLLVNNLPCDVSSLNPIANPSDRLRFSSVCPFQLGGQVFTNISQLDYGRATGRVSGLVGVYQTFLALRNCDNPPKNVQDKIDGIVS